MSQKRKGTHTAPQHAPNQEPEQQRKDTVKAVANPLENNWQTFLPYLLFLCFAVFAFWLLACKNADYLYAVQERSLFIHDESFFHHRMMFIGGFAQWIGCYLTQFFYYPWLGALMLIVILGLIYALTLATYRNTPFIAIAALIPLFALLTSEVCIGYWLYYVKLEGYWFTLPICYLVMSIALFLYRLLKGKMQLAWIAVSGILLYPFIGAWALIGTAWMAIDHCVLHRTAAGKRSFVSIIVGTLTIIIVPVVCYQFYDRNMIETAWVVDFPIFQSDKVTSPLLSVPFIIAALAPALYVVLTGRQPQADRQQRSIRKQRNIILTIAVACFVIGCVITYHANFDNYNYHAEFRIYRAIDESDFDKALEELRKAPGPNTRQMVVSKNIALMHKGTIGNEMFKYDNSGEPPYVFDSLKVHMVQTAGTQIYYNYGKANFACRWAIENGVEYGFDVDEIKMLVRTSMMSGEYKAAQKYIDILLNTTFHKDWARQWLAMLHDNKRYRQSAEYRNIAPLRVFDNTLDGDDGLCEMYIINYFSHMHREQPKFQEETLIYALVQKDIQLFWPRFFHYATLHEQEQMPIHYQEAALLYGNLEHEVDISKMPFDQQRVLQRYNSFQQLTQSMLQSGMTAEQVGEATKSTFGDTFWWFYFFCRNIHSY